MACGRLAEQSGFAIFSVTSLTVGFLMKGTDPMAPLKAGDAAQRAMNGLFQISIPMLAVDTTFVTKINAANGPAISSS
jgi:hypothetical protein